MCDVCVCLCVCVCVSVGKRVKGTGFVSMSWALTCAVVSTMWGEDTRAPLCVCVCAWGPVCG